MRIFYDIDTQNDFMNKGGALYVPGAEEIKSNLKLLTDFVRENKASLVGSVDRHFGTLPYESREGELARYGGPFPDHCMDRTSGQIKISETILTKGNRFFGTPDNNRYVTHERFHNMPKEPIPEGVLNGFNKLKSIRDRFDSAESRWDFLRSGVNLEYLTNNIKFIDAARGVAGFYFEKQSYDVFTNPSFEKFLDLAEVNEAVVYGVATDYCVKAAVLGMQKMGIQTYVVEDAISGVDPQTTKQALDEMVAEKAKLVTTKDVLEWRLG